MVHDVRKMKKGITRFCRLFSFAEKLFEKEIGESLSIPFAKIEPLMSEQQANHLSVTRRAFRAYVAISLGKSQRDIDTGKPSILYQLCAFSQEDSAAKVTKKKDLIAFS